jgi:hypothetical protein
VSYRRDFTGWSAIEVNYNYTRLLKKYSTGSATQSRVDEATLGYVLSFHTFTNGHVLPLVETGLGLQARHRPLLQRGGLAFQ